MIIRSTIVLIIIGLTGLNQQVFAVETSLTLDAQFQWTELGVKANSDNNPNNSIFELPEQRGLLELQPRLSLDWEAISINVEPRLIYLNQKNDGDVNEHESEATVRYWELNWLSDNLTIGLSKTVMLWGPSVIFSPSNRYHHDNGSSSPNNELLAREFIETNFYINDRWDFELIANIGEGDQDISNFNSSADLRFNWIGDSSNASVQASWLNPGWGLGGSVQWTVNDGLLVYLDGLFAPFKTIEQTVFEISNPNSTLNSKYKDHHFRSVAGLSYTFENGLNIALDYYYNGSGFEADTSQQLLEQSNQSVNQLLQTGFDSNTVDFIRDVNTLPSFSLSKHYGVSRISQNNLRGQFAVAYILIKNLDDHSRQHIVTLDCECGDRLSVFANANYLSGDTLTEFGRFFDSQLTLGLRWVFL